MKGFNLVPQIAAHLSSKNLMLQTNYNLMNMPKNEVGLSKPTFFFIHFNLKRVSRPLIKRDDPLLTNYNPMNIFKTELSQLMAL